MIHETTGKWPQNIWGRQGNSRGRVQDPRPRRAGSRVALAVARALVEDFDRSNAASAGAGADAGAARLRDALRGIDLARAAAFRGEMLRLVESLAEGGERGGG